MKKIILFIVLAVGINNISKSQETTLPQSNELAMASNTPVLNIENTSEAQENVVATKLPFETKANPNPKKNKNRRTTTYVLIGAAVVAVIVIYTLIANSRIEQR